MCGRFTQTTSYAELKKIFGVGEESDDVTGTKVAARYNIAPSQEILNVRPSEGGGGREAVLVKWGLVPSWAKDPDAGARLINARSETVESKPSFRAAFKRRRCLIPADGFYEWGARAAGRKQPYLFRMKDESAFAFAGLWERWQAPNGQALETCAIITTEANALLAKIHDRMPVILHSDNYDLWLGVGDEDGDENGGGGDPRRQGERLGLLRPYPAKRMKSHPVSLLVNNPARQGAELIGALIANSK